MEPAKSQPQLLLVRSPHCKYFAVTPNGLIHSKNPVPTQQSLYEEACLSHYTAVGEQEPFPEQKASRE